MSIIRTEKFIKNMKVNVGFYFISVILTFFARSLFIKMLGADINGLNSLYNSLIGFLNVAELGVGTAFGYALYGPLSKNENQKIKEIMELFKIYYIRIGKIIFILGMVLSIILPFLIKGQINIKLAFIYYYIYLINCSISYLFTYKQTLIIADQKQYKIAYILNGIKIVKIILQCIILIILKNFFIWLLVETIFSVVGMILANKKIDKEYVGIFVENQRIDIKIIKAKYKGIGKNIKDMFFHKISSFVIYQTDAIVISLVSNLKETGIYSNYMLIINSILNLITMAIGSMMPSIGNLIVEEKKEKIYQNFRILFLFDNLIAIFIVTVCYSVINEFMILWIGKNYIFSNVIVMTLLINLYIQISRGSVDRFKAGYGIYWDVQAPIIESFLNLIISVVLAMKIGIIGVFIGTIVSNLIIIIGWKPYILFRSGFKIKISKYVGQACKIYIVNFMIFIIEFFLYKMIIVKIWFMDKIISFGIHVILISITCSIVMFLIYIKDKDAQQLLKIIMGQFKKKILKN